MSSPSTSTTRRRVWRSRTNGTTSASCRASTGVIPIKDFVAALVDIGYDGPARAEPFNAALNALDDDAACAKTIAAVKQAVGSP